MLPRSAIALRFPPGADEVRKVRDESKWRNRRRPEGTAPRYRLSLWASPVFGSVAETKLALIRAAGLGGLRLGDTRNANFYWTTIGDVQDAGFSIVKDGYADEPAEHWSVVLPNADRATVERFLMVLHGPEETGSQS